MKTIMFIVFFLLMGAFFIISKEGIKLNSKENIQTFFNYYFSWTQKLFDNSKTVTGYVVRLEWLPE